MATICKRCRRVNPREAIYCYHDGSCLDQAGSEDVPADGSAVNVGATPFSVPFVLPSGDSCDNFDELALAFHADPATALGLLRVGDLEAFLRAQGRPDIAAAIRAALRATNSERGLDDFLGRLPARSLTPPRLSVIPAVVELGALGPGQDLRFELALHNEGMRLLYGMASCASSPWLGLGDGPPLRRKMIQFSDRIILPVQVLGQYLRAQGKPQEAEVRLESNGGTATVLVHAQVPVRPFPEGVLAGATTPRELAEKARTAPGKAVVLLESGAVARWYKDNGWEYPVSGPAVSGVAALQQFFEALGLARPPRVELSENAIHLKGCPGETIEYVLAAVTEEHRVAVAHGTSDQPWLRVGPSVSRGRSSFLPLSVTGVPGQAGDTLHAHVWVVANGNQRFKVPVTLAVVERRRTAMPGPAPDPAAHSPQPPAEAGPVAPPEPSGKAASGCRRIFLTLLFVVLLVLALLGAVLHGSLAPAGTKPSNEEWGRGEKRAPT